MKRKAHCEGSRETKCQRQHVRRHDTTAVIHPSIHSFIQLSAPSTMLYNRPGTFTTHSLTSDARPACPGSYKPHCHRQLLRPLLAALSTPTHSQLLEPVSTVLPPSLLPSYQPAWPLFGPRRTLATSTRPAPCSAHPSAIAGCAAQPMDWPHFGPPTRLDRAFSRPATAAGSQSQGRHLIDEPTVRGIPRCDVQGASPILQSVVSQHAARPSRYLLSRQRPFQRRQLTALLSLRGP